ncbi:helix-turn-helix domain-containing protein [Desulfopila sp. IMCC35008]|uniref:helix-turn-helix domain-containing protein n=1 Tax=Desulfopila sp. IMCC35008 TaxID=2653858 RepID=UPI0013D73C07
MLNLSELQPISVRDLCAVAGVSEPTLQYLFQWKYGITPMAYLKRVRLNDVRKVLYREIPGKLKIADIANRRGFWHMGQFAKDYHQLFGELPSDTLRKI